MTDKNRDCSICSRTRLSRRTALKGLGRGGRPRRSRRASSAMRRRRARSRSRSASRCTAPASAPPTAAGTSAPPTAAVKLINDDGGIGGRPIEIIAEDDGTDPEARRRGGRRNSPPQHKVDVAFGTLFSHVVMGSAPRAGELKMPYFVVSRGPSRRLRRAEPLHLPARHHRREEPGLVDGAVDRRQSRQEGHDDLPGLSPSATTIATTSSAAIKAQGGRAPTLIPIPPTESSFTRYFPQIPADTEVLYHVMVGPAVLTFVKELGEHSRLEPSADLRLHRLARGEPTRRAPASNSSRAPISGKPIRAMPAPTRPSSTSSIAKKSASTTNGASRRRPERRLDLLAHVRLLGDALRHQAGDGGSRLQVRDDARQEGADRGDRGDRRRSPKATSIRRATRPSTARSTSASATRTSRRWKAASSTSCTARRSRTGSTSRRRTTRRWRCRLAHKRAVTRLP